MPNFKSSGAYKRWAAYGHIHGVMSGKGRKKVTIKGKKHAVKHTRKKK